MHPIISVPPSANHRHAGCTLQGTENAPSLNEIKDIRSFVFRLDGDTPELRQAAVNSLNKLKNEFPDYEFDVIFGVER